MKQLKYIVMEKLELKHLAGYLPYGIPAILSKKGIFNQDDEYPNPRTLELGIIKNISFWYPEITGQLHISETYSFDFDEIDEIEVVLHPLSDLTKEIEVNGQKFVPIEYYGHLRFKEISTFKGGSRSLEFIQARELELLYKMRFDPHGLIEKGLAIDINTLNKQ